MGWDDHLSAGGTGESRQRLAAVLNVFNAECQISIQRRGACQWMRL